MREKLPKGWERRDSGVLYFWGDVFELCVKYNGMGDGHCRVFMRANGEAYEIGEDYTTEAEGMSAAMEYARELLTRVSKRLG